MELNEIDVRNVLLKDYVTVDEVKLLSSDDYYAVITGRLKSETKIYNDKPKEELYMQIEYRGSKRQNWLKLTNPILTELGTKLGYLSSTWVGHVVMLRLETWKVQEVVRIKVIK